MDYRFIEKNDVRMIEVSPIAQTGLAEAYCSTRYGGISTGTTASMNLNIYKKLDIENGKPNLKIFCNAIGADPDKLITNRLIYGTDCVRCVSSDDVIDIYDESISAHADGLVTNDPEITLYMYAADCAIIQFVHNDPENRVVACCHAGWRNSLCGIIQSTVRTMCEKYNCDRDNIIAVILPSIGECCFEVGSEVAEQFEPDFSEFISYTAEKPHIDLFGVNSKILLESGLQEENIHRINLCTHCTPDERYGYLFHSFRRGPVEGKAHLNGMNGMFIKLTK
ncbi:MAG: polyphenol oxidase family protein [Ruminococcus flavefaciens]|nr:polyphenol oxidase family protein [Ruminococcus flavefaciens]MCM1229843.1 polyphenol oxidase family protein [Ruminococcus flavefaciens]